MASFIAVYQGPTIGTARLIAVATDPALVRDVADRMLNGATADGKLGAAEPVVDALEAGRRIALRLIRDTAAQAARAESTAPSPRLREAANAVS